MAPQEQRRLSPRQRLGCLIAWLAPLGLLLVGALVEEPRVKWTGFVIFLVLVAWGFYLARSRPA